MDEGKNRDNTFKAGFTMQFLNIKVILYGITVFSLFIIHSYRTPILMGLFAPVLALFGLMATSCWGFGGNIFRNSLRNHYRWFNLIMAGLLIYTAVASLI